MSHLDTAYKLGAAQALHDFQVELQKQAWQPGSSVPGAPSTVARGSAAEAVRGSAASGLAPTTGSQTQVPTGSGKGMMTMPGMQVGRGAKPALGGPPASPMLARR